MDSSVLNSINSALGLPLSPNDSRGGTIYAGGKATYLPNKGAFYNYVAQNQGLGAQQFSNNPWGVSDQELQGLLGQSQSGGGSQLDALLKALQGASGGAPAIPVGHAYNYDTTGAYNTAMQQAHGQVDPYYNKMINQFNSDYARNQGNAQSSLDLQKAGIQQNLQNTVQQNDITGQRVGEDTGNALGNLANAQQNYKQTEGLNFDQAQRALGTQLGQQGTATSGIGQGQVAQAQTQEALGQQAQGQQYQVQRQAQQLFMNRSLDDLSRGTAIAGQQADLSTKGAQFDFDKAMADLASSHDTQLRGAQYQQQQDLASQARSVYDLNLRNWIAGLKGNSFDIQATTNKYQPI